MGTDLREHQEVTADGRQGEAEPGSDQSGGNAIKYNDSDGRVTLDADHKFLCEGCRDSGIGIPEDRITFLFLPWIKHVPERLAVPDWGLSITKNVIQMHHGVIDVESI